MEAISCDYLVVIEFQEGFIKRCDEAQSEIIFRLLDFLDDTGVTGPLDILVPDGDQVVSLSHTSDLNNKTHQARCKDGGDNSVLTSARLPCSTPAMTTGASPLTLNP